MQHRKDKAKGNMKEKLRDIEVRMRRSHKFLIRHYKEIIDKMKKKNFKMIIC